jgi:hypothetical protein
MVLGFVRVWDLYFSYLTDVVPNSTFPKTLGGDKMQVVF